MKKQIFLKIIILLLFLIIIIVFLFLPIYKIDVTKGEKEYSMYISMLIYFVGLLNSGEYLIITGLILVHILIPIIVFIIIFKRVFYKEGS